MKALTRRPAFWIAYALLSAAALAVAIHLFPRAIPLVNLDVRMNRVEAIATGEALAVRYKLGPATPAARRASTMTERRRTTSSSKAAGAPRSRN